MTKTVLNQKVTKMTDKHTAVYSKAVFCFLLNESV